MKKFFSLLVILFISSLNISTIYGQAPERKNIAVMDLESRGGLSQAEAGTLTDRLRSMLVGTNTFIVVDRGKMDAILKEVGFQQTGCTTTECAVEVGKILNVTNMVTGSIGKLGQTYSLDISVIDVSTSQISKSFSKNYKGEIDGLLDLMGEIANQLAGSAAPPPVPVVKAPDMGSISVTAEPVTAGVYLDGKLVGTTPLKLEQVAVGQHSVKVVADNYRPVEKKIMVEKDELANQRIKLEMTDEHKRELATAEKEKEKQLRASRPKKGGKTWLWVGGALVAGGAAAAVLAGGGGDTGGPGGTPDLPPPSSVTWPPQ